MEKGKYNILKAIIQGKNMEENQMEENLKKELFFKKENGWENVNEEEKNKIFELSKKYMDFLNLAKTEREFVKQARKIAEENGYRDIIEFQTLKPGDKIYP